MKQIFTIQKEVPGSLARAGVIHTPHGDIQTPAFIPVGTKATVKSLSPEQVKSLGAEAVLSNTYHLYLQPGHNLVKEAGGVAKFMNWNGPTFTDSGGFQVFSLGVAFGKRMSKISKADTETKNSNKEHSNILQNVRMLEKENDVGRLAKVDEEGVTFRSHVDGSSHRFTPEKSIQIQHDLGADIIFAFDECPATDVTNEYQKEAMERTHRWATRSLEAHKKLGGDQLLFGIVQGGRHENLRRESAKIIGAGDFDGFGIGGSFDKEDMGNAVRWVNEVLPKEKPRHLLGIGDPADLIEAVANGCDTFDCVAPTRQGRTGSLYTKAGRLNIRNAEFTRDFSPIEKDCDCYTCRNFTRAYLSHLFRAEEMFAATLSSIHNLRFLVKLVNDMRKSILDGSFESKKAKFLRG